MHYGKTEISCYIRISISRHTNFFFQPSLCLNCAINHPLPPQSLEVIRCSHALDSMSATTPSQRSENRHVKSRALHASPPPLPRTCRFVHRDPVSREGMVSRLGAPSQEKSVSFTLLLFPQITRGCERPPERKGAALDVALDAAAPLFSVPSSCVSFWHDTSRV